VHSRAELELCASVAWWLSAAKNGGPDFLQSNFLKGTLHPFPDFLQSNFLKGTLHPFALSFVSLETQSHFWMVMVYSLTFP